MQNKFTHSYLAQFPLRDTLRNRLSESFNYPRVTVPEMITGKRVFYRRNTGLQNQSVLYMRDNIKGAPLMILDPSSALDRRIDCVRCWTPSPDGRYVAYALAQGGADWHTVHVRDVASMRDMTDTLQWVRFSGLSWTRDGRGFFDDATRSHQLGRRSRRHCRDTQSTTTSSRNAATAGSPRIRR